MAELTQLDRIEALLVNIQERVAKLEDRDAKIEKRFDDGAKEFRELKWDVWLGNSAVKALCVLAGAKEHVMALTARQAERFNGSMPMKHTPVEDAPTDPGAVDEEPPATNDAPQ